MTNSNVNLTQNTQTKAFVIIGRGFYTDLPLWIQEHLLSGRLRQPLPNIPLFNFVGRDGEMWQIQVSPFNPDFPRNARKYQFFKGGVLHTFTNFEPRAVAQFERYAFSF